MFCFAESDCLGSVDGAKAGEFYGGTADLGAVAER